MTVKIKICGLSEPATVTAAIQAGARYTGFVFYAKSPRNITAQRALELAALIPESIKKVGVFVNPDDEQLAAILDHMPLDMIQLHGRETAARVTQIKARFALPVIKAIAVAGPKDIEGAKPYESAADMLLFDAKAPISLEDALPGGNGLRFDWQLIRGCKWKIPWMLSGGLNSDNIQQALAISGAKSVDISSGVEDRPGVKNIAKITDFISKATNR